MAFRVINERCTRLFDLTVVALFLLLLLSLWRAVVAVIALPVRLSSLGPAPFRQVPVPGRSRRRGT